jgi:hypothetical protein
MELRELTELELKLLAGQPMYEGPLVEMALLAMQSYQALQSRRLLMYGSDAPLANVNSNVVRLIMIALEKLHPIDIPHAETPPPPWLASLWEDK